MYCLFHIVRISGILEDNNEFRQSEKLRSFFSAKYHLHQVFLKALISDIFIEQTSD